MKRKALGKGLRSLIPEAPPQVASPPRTNLADGLMQIDIDRIVPNRKQPREQFDEDQLLELARSLKSQGVLQPVVVRPRAEGGYELVAGERRWRAAQLAGLLKLPAVVRTVTDDKLLELALIENLQRADLNPVETAVAYQALVDDLNLSQQEVADRVGKQRATVTNALRLLNLPRKVQEMIRDGRLRAGHAKALAGLTNANLQIELAESFAQGDLSVRQAEAVVARATNKRQATRKTEIERDPNVVAAEETLQQALGTKARIVPSGKGGKLEIHYYSDEDLTRIYDVIIGGTR